MTWTFFVENFLLLVVLLRMCLMNKRGECYGNFTMNGTLSHRLVIVLVKLCNLVDHSVFSHDIRCNHIARFPFE